MSRTQALVLAAGLVLPTALPGAEPGSRRPYGIDDLLAARRLSDTQVSPDGRLLAFALRELDMAANRYVSHIWISTLKADAGPGEPPPEPRRLTNGKEGESGPRWSPDGKTIAFISSRAPGPGPQVWLIPVDGGEAKQITSLSTGASGIVWSPTGNHIAFTSDIRPDVAGGDAARKKREEDDAASGVQAIVIDRLLYRHWNEWRRGKRTHVFVAALDGAEPVDVTPGDRDAPPFSLGGPDAYAFSPDGKEVAFTRGPTAATESKSTNADLCVVPSSGGEAACLTESNPGWDGSPVWSPDGNYIAYRSQERDGYEADRFRLAVVERRSGRTTYLAGDVDRSADEILWQPDGRGIWFLAEDKGLSAVYAAPLASGRSSGPTRKVLSGVQLGTLSMPRDGSFIVAESQSLLRPAEAVLARLDAAGGSAGTPGRLTGVNDAHFEPLDMPSRKSVRYRGALGDDVQAWLLLPPGAAEKPRLPFILFIHGGPQSVFGDAFSYRWNAALYASLGYAVMLPNFHGSTGFGQAFTERISRDWAGAAFEDLQKAVDWAVAEGIADPDRLAAMGGSFGGYMVNWILGHDHRFKALVSHAGVYNLESMYGSTEETWFPEWELGGPPWEKGADYEKFSPHRYAGSFRTPTLVIHGELDYRVPVTEGFQLFTALQRRGIESKLLYYPDEGHWIQKPKNSKLWNETVMAWLADHLKPGR